MIGIDTNVLVRFLVQDDAGQSQRASKAFKELSPEGPGYITTVVLVETFWVLTRTYKFDKDDVLTTLNDLVTTESIVVQDGNHVARAFALASEGAEFPDALIAATCRAKGCTTILSFDRGATRALGFTSP